MLYNASDVQGTMISGDHSFGITAHAEKIKDFVKTVVQSNQRFEEWNRENRDNFSGCCW